MSAQTPERDDSVLAAEYVIGVLPQTERAEVEHRLSSDTALADHVAVWQRHLAALNGDYGTAPVPASVKVAIDARLFETKARRARSGLVARALWLMAAAVLGALIFFWPERPGFEAVLTADNSAFRFVVAANADADRLDVTLISGTLPTGQAFELWTIPDGGAPVSLGVFEPGGDLVLAPDLALSEGALLAVSLEPLGGSPTGQPTGPVVALGSLGPT